MNNEIKTISPFRNFCITVGALPTSYLESMSYYEMLCWLCKYLENTINPAINQNAEALKELQEYVSNYFKDLDVQEEINNKLDEMADDGTLAQIINVEMIGTLSNLTTTNKTDLVNAINEVNALIKKLNFTQFDTYEITPTIGSATVYYGPGGGLQIATNEDGSIAKIYGELTFYEISHDGTTQYTTTVPTKLRPTTNININSAGVRQWNDQNGSFTASVNIEITTDGYINFQFYNDENVTRQCIVFTPCIYFLTDFGD